jgi:periplasmic copper chaperone A
MPPAAHLKNDKGTMTKQLLAVLSAALLAGAVHAAGYRAGNISITDPHARPTVPGQPGGAAYFTLENTGGSADRLVGVSSPAAQSAEIHTMQMDGDIMRMREAGELTLPPAARVEMKPGMGYHIMLQGLKQPLQTGAAFAMTLTFEKAGKVDVTVIVDGRQARPAGHAH